MTTPRLFAFKQRIGEASMICARNEIGEPVDWFLIYKTPKLDGGVQSDAASGYGYAYADADNPTPGRSIYSLDSTSGAIHSTLAQLQEEGASYILYNDERPDGKPDNGELGHTKGVLCWDSQSNTGFWLLHSWPLFPVIGAVHAPTPIYGQTFLCLSLDVASMEQIAGQMLSHHEPQVYCSANVLGGSFLGDLAAGHLTSKPAPSFDVLDAKTCAGMPFKVLAKNRQWGGDYWNQAEVELEVSMNVETWIRGPVAPILDTDGVHKSFDIKYINLGALGMHYAWPETADHAKWGISADPANPWVLIGDINRMISQRKRGGGGIAFRSLPLWSALSKTDLVIAPPGKGKATSLEHIRKTHAA